MQNKPAITTSILIEELINNYPFSVCYLRDKGIRCIPCGDPVSGTFEEAAKEKHFDNNAIAHFVNEMNQIAEEEFVLTEKKH